MKMLTFVCLSGLVACGGLSDAENEEPCRNAGFSIANRIYECFGGDERANEAYEDFVAAYRCVITDLDASQFECAAAINDLSCAAVIEAEGNFDALLNASPVCGQILGRADGLGPWIDGSHVSATGNEVCWGVLTTIDERRAECADGTQQTPSTYDVLGESYDCVAGYLAGAMPPELLACEQAIDAADCSAATTNSVADWLAVSDSCTQVYAVKE